MPKHPRWIDYMPVDDLPDAATNPKGHADELIEQSITRFAFSGSPAIDERTGRLVGGHGRRDALRRMRAAGAEPPEGVVVRGDTWLVPVERGWSSRDDAEAEAFGLALNRTSEIGGWQDDQLRESLERLAALPEGLDGVGFTQADLDELVALASGNEKPTGDPDAVPVPQAEAVTTVGDLWLLGEHRLLCGDAMKRATYLALLGDERPELLLTDPPYGVSHGSGITDAKAIRGDLSQAVIPISFAMALEVLDPDARLYIFGGSGQFGMYLGLWDLHLQDMPRVIVWVKGSSFVLRQLAYHSQFELIYWGWKGSGGKARYWYGDRKQTDVWNVDRDGGAGRVHPTQKPTALLGIAINNSCAPNGLVLDPFGGSGATLIAAAEHGRRARLLELDPLYCDVICKRWFDYTGQPAIHAETNQPHPLTVSTDG